MDDNFARHKNFVAVASTVTPGKWWVFSEYSSSIYAIGIIHYVSGDYAVTAKFVGAPDEFLGDAKTLLDALQIFGG
jgi:hypothetical protein